MGRRPLTAEQKLRLIEINKKSDELDIDFIIKLIVAALVKMDDHDAVMETVIKVIDVIGTEAMNAASNAGAAVFDPDNPVEIDIAVDDVKRFMVVTLQMRNIAALLQGAVEVDQEDHSRHLLRIDERELNTKMEDIRQGLVRRKIQYDLRTKRR